MRNFEHLLRKCEQIDNCWSQCSLGNCYVERVSLVIMALLQENKRTPKALICTKTVGQQIKRLWVRLWVNKGIPLPKATSIGNPFWTLAQRMAINPDNQCQVIDWFAFTQIHSPSPEAGFPWSRSSWKALYSQRIFKLAGWVISRARKVTRRARASITSPDRIEPIRLSKI